MKALKISELIQELEKMKKEHGDLPCYYVNAEKWCFEPMEEVTYYDETDLKFSSIAMEYKDKVIIWVG